MNILILESNMFFLHGMMAILTKNGHNVTGCLKLTSFYQQVNKKYNFLIVDADLMKNKMLDMLNQMSCNPIEQKNVIATVENYSKKIPNFLVKAVLRKPFDSEILLNCINS